MVVISIWYLKFKVYLQIDISTFKEAISVKGAVDKEVISVKGQLTFVDFDNCLMS